jgi:hypothetical protein
MFPWTWSVDPGVAVPTPTRLEVPNIEVKLVVGTLRVTAYTFVVVIEFVIYVFPATNRVVPEGAVVPIPKNPEVPKIEVTLRLVIFAFTVNKFPNLLAEFPIDVVEVTVSKFPLKVENAPWTVKF